MDCADDSVPSAAEDQEGRRIDDLFTAAQYACEQRTAEESGGEDETLRGRGWAAQDHRGAERLLVPIRAYGECICGGSRRISHGSEEDRRSGAGVCVCDCILKTVCRRTFSDGRTGRSADRSGDRISGLCRLPEKNRAEGINMELRALNDFLAIAREENITRAAEQLHVTPPMLSRQSADLEEVPEVQAVL